MTNDYYYKYNDKVNTSKVIIFYIIAIIVIIIAGIFIYNNYYSFITTTYVSINDANDYKMQIKTLYSNRNDNSNYTWAIENKDIATVSENGVITPIKNGDTTLIIKSKKGYNVKKVQIHIEGLDESNNQINNNIINNNDNNSSSNNIDNNNGISNNSQTDNSSKNENKSIAISSISFKHSSLNVYVDDKMYLETNIVPIDATNVGLKFTSSNTNIVTVDNNGYFVAKAVGTAVITVETNNGKKAECKITVNAKPINNKNIEIMSISLNKSSLAMKVSEKFTLRASISPSNATDLNINWTSSNSKVASVDNKGQVIAKGVGEAVITAKSNNGKKAECRVVVSETVKPPVNTDIKVTGISLNMTSNTIYLNSNNLSFNLIGTVSPSNATNKSIEWSTSNSNIATVSNGLVTAKGIGDVTITAKTVDGSYQASMTLHVKKKMIIVIGASQVVRMNDYKSSYSSSNYNYSVNNSTLNYVYLSGSGFAYQTGDGWNRALSIINSYGSYKNNTEFFIFFPLSGNDIKTFSCSNITTNNQTIKNYVNNYNNVISNVKNNGYNVKTFVVSMHPVKVSQSSSSYVVTNENSNSCKVNYRSNRKYYQFNKTINSIISNGYTANLTYESLFNKIMQTNEFGKNFSYLVTYNTTDGIHWDSATTKYYVDLMFNTTGVL